MKTTQKFKQTEIGTIPEDWDVKELGELNTEKCPSLNPQMYKNEIFEYYSIPDYQENKKPSFVKGSTIKSSKIVFKDKMILFGRLNPRVEKVWMVEPISNKKIIGSGEWITILPDNINYFSKYLYYLCWSKFVMPIAKENVSGTTPSRQRVISSFFYKIKVPLPIDPKEQQAIIQALSETDKLIQQFDKLISKKKNIKKGIMQDLLTGKRRLSGFSGDWEEKSLGMVASFEHGHGLSKADLKEDGKRKCIHYGQLFTEYKESITEIKSRTDIDTNLVYSKENDVLMPTSDVTPRGLATASCIKEGGIVLGGGILIIRLHKGYDGLFLSYFITQNKEVVLKLTKGSTVFHIYANDLSNLEILFPKYKEQQAIAKILSDMDLEIEELEQKRDKYQMIKKGMMQQLLTGKVRLKWKK